MYHYKKKVNIIILSSFPIAGGENVECTYHPAHVLTA